MRRADRLFQLVNLLRARQPLTARELADDLGVSVRSVYRYVDDLSVSGIPIYGEPGLGYRLNADFELPPLALTADELNALLLSVQLLTATTGVEYPAAARSLQAKLLASVPNTFSATSVFAPVLQDRSANAVLWDQLHQAIQQQGVLHFQYVTAEGESSERDVWPLGLFYWGGKWTLGSWCLLRQAFRDFRLDRMQGVKATSCFFQATDAINLKKYLQDRSKY